MFVSDTITRKARKQHKCSWCGETIEKGATYHTWTSIDGCWVRMKMHLECFWASWKWTDEYLPEEGTMVRGECREKE